MARSLPEGIQQALEPICDALKRLTDGVGGASGLPALIEQAVALVVALDDAGCIDQAEHLEGAVRHMRTASGLWDQHAAAPSSASYLAYHDEAYQAYDRACWALTLDAFEDAA